MRRAEMQWQIIGGEGITTSSLSMHKTIQHLIEVINEMQGEIEKLQTHTKADNQTYD